MTILKNMFRNNEEAALQFRFDYLLGAVTGGSYDYLVLPP